MIEKEYAFVIPVYNPDVTFINLVNNLQIKTNSKIFIINDGSSFEAKHIFEKLKKIYYKNEKIILLNHAVNLGKGAALKTVFNKILTDYNKIRGIVTLDSDGQNSVKDCLRVMEYLKMKPEYIIPKLDIFLNKLL